MVADVLILGAGAAGLMCAWRAARRGRQVLVLDHGAKPGLKLRVTGGGACNFTNREVAAGHYRCANPHFVRSALARFGPQDMLALLEDHDIAWEERDHGRLFCLGSAGEVAGMLVRLARNHGAELRLGCRVLAVGREGDTFTVATSQGRFTASSLVVALGGPAWPQVGATGLGLDIARRFGLGVIAPQPALAPLLLPAGEALSDLAGIAVPVALSVGEQRFHDQLLFTHRGVSGPAALQASLYWQPGSALHVDFLPETPFETLLSGAGGAAKLRNLLARRLPARLAAALLGQLGEATAGNLRRQDLEAATALVHGREVRPQATAGWKKAEVSAGGVDTAALSSKTMECRKVPGLYFVGEVLDVTGQLGGYNLHWAWASGHAAGEVC